jgi:hypothetical protein
MQGFVNEAPKVGRAKLLLSLGRPAGSATAGGPSEMPPAVAELKLA